MEFVWKIFLFKACLVERFPFTDCLVATFSSDIFGSNFIFKNCLVEISFFWGGKMFSSNIFL